MTILGDDVRQRARKGLDLASRQLQNVLPHLLRTSHWQRASDALNWLGPIYEMLNEPDCDADDVLADLRAVVAGLEFSATAANDLTLSEPQRGPLRMMRDVRDLLSEVQERLKMAASI